MKLTLAERFLLTRRRMGITQEHLAKLLGCARKTVYRVERGGVISARTTARFEILEQRHVNDQHFTGRR